MADILGENESLVRGGMAVLLLDVRSKATKDVAWSERPVPTFEQLLDEYTPGRNVGVRLGKWSKIDGMFLHVIDMDIRDSFSTAEAVANLHSLFPGIDFDSVPTVASGSGGNSRHFYLTCAEAFPSKKLAVSHKKVAGKDGKQHWTWEIELYGTGKQVVLPPSIHPDTGKPYRWIRKPDLREWALGLGPEVPADLLRALTGERPAELGSLEGVPERLGMTLEAAEEILADLPPDLYVEDREGWLTVGMALHHEFEASPEAYALWCKYSSKSEKFDRRDQARVWKSFRPKLKMVRMASLRSAGRDKRIDRMFEDVSSSEDAEDVLAHANGVTYDRVDELLGNALPPPNWIAFLDMAGENVKPTLTNLAMILQNDPRFKDIVEFNEFKEQVVTRRQLNTDNDLICKNEIKDTVNGERWQDIHDANIRTIIEAPVDRGYGMKVSERDMTDAVALAAAKKTFHPVRQYLQSLKWDGVPRVESLFIKYLGEEDNGYTRGIARMMLMGAVVRVFEPGHKFDFVVIIEGKQGKRKSTFIETLARGWFCELEGDWGDTKGLVEKMQGHWICEIPELSGFTRSEVQQIKGAMSRKTDTARLAYAHRAGDFKRQCIFVGSTNEIDYLKDSTGGRRFWPVEANIEEIDIDGLKVEIDQIWAEAYVLYCAERKKHPSGDLPLYLSEDAVRIEAERRQESRRPETSEDWMADEIAKWLETEIPDPEADDMDIGAVKVVRTETSLMEVWRECFHREAKDYNEQTARTLGRAVRHVEGWEIQTGPRTTKYGRQKVYRKVGAMRFPTDRPEI